MNEIKDIDYINIDTAIGNIICVLGELERNRIFNSYSIRGPELLKVLSDTTSTTFDVSDSFVVFEIEEDKDNDMNSIIPGEGVIESIMSYNAKLKIYGGGSHELAKKLISRVRTDENIFAIREKYGIFVDNISFPESTTEFINNTMWQRVDTTIHIMTKNSYKDKNINEIVNELPQLDIEGLNIRTM